MMPLCIRARLLNGYVARDPWSPTLDGILAAVVMRERLGAEAYAISAASPRTWSAVEGLPLAVERDGDLWWYQASSPRPVGEAGRERRHYHRRFDDQHERFLVEGVRRVMTAAGPYKATRLHDTRVICRGVEWHVVGDREEIDRLLRSVSQVGARRGCGYGEVVEWLIGAGDEDQARHRRPLPRSYAERVGIRGPVVPWTLVPPARHSIVDCVMPEAPANAG